MYKIEILGTSINISINAIKYIILSRSLSQIKFSLRSEQTAAPMNRITFTFDCEKSGVLRMKFMVTTIFLPNMKLISLQKTLIFLLNKIDFDCF